VSGIRVYVQPDYSRDRRGQFGSGAPTLLIDDDSLRAASVVVKVSRTTWAALPLSALLRVAQRDNSMVIRVVSEARLVGPHAIRAAGVELVMGGPS